MLVVIVPHALKTEVVHTDDDWDEMLSTMTHGYPFPGQLAVLSLDCLQFGNIPLQSAINRLVLLSNMSEKSTISFNWDCSKEPAKDGLHTVTHSYNCFQLSLCIHVRV